jgi:hypothetical protein
MMKGKRKRSRADKERSGQMPMTPESPNTARFRWSLPAVTSDEKYKGGLMTITLEWATWEKIAEELRTESTGVNNWKADSSPCTYCITGEMNEKQPLSHIPRGTYPLKITLKTSVDRSLLQDRVVRTIDYISRLLHAT